MCSFRCETTLLLHNDDAEEEEEEEDEEEEVEKKIPKSASLPSTSARKSCLRRTVLGLWCAQIYDFGAANALLFKFNNRGGGNNGGEEGGEQQQEERELESACSSNPT